ncbi:MAG: glycosyltransferase [Rhodospirillaceae bacterium]|nr:glycosyltransferase [Rhodospirillaceae bacterium]
MADILISALLALWLAFAAVGLYGAVHFLFQRRHYARIAETFPRPDPAPAAAVILPLKGAPNAASHCLETILAQDYPNFRLIVAIEQGDAAALTMVRAFAAAHGAGRAIEIVEAPRADRRGQKVENLLAALATLRPHDRAVCFVDADAAWPQDALSTLMRELSSWGDTLLLSGNRWLVPAGTAAATIVAAAGLAIAANAKSPAWDLAWGGTMALRRDLLDSLDLPALWDRSISDDVPLSAALRRRGTVKTMPNLVVPSPTDVSLGGALNFARRQYAMLRLYAPRHWLFTLLLQIVFFAGIGAALASILRPAPALVRGMAAAAVAVAILRGVVQALAARRCLPPEAARRLRGACILDTLLPMVPALLHAYGLVATLGVRRLRWAGIDYRFAGARVVAVERSAPSPAAAQMIEK